MGRLGPQGCGRLSGTRGQHLVEYAIVVSVAVAAAVGVQTYLKRAIQAKLKGEVDRWLDIRAGGSLPQECVDKGITDPGKCTQVIGLVAQDVTKLEEAAGGVTTLSEAERITQQQTGISYLNPGGPVTTVTTRGDGTSFQVTGKAHSLTESGQPPNFIRRPQLPNGIPMSGNFGMRSPTPSVPQTSATSPVQTVSETQQHRRARRVGDGDDQDAPAE